MSFMSVPALDRLLESSEIDPTAVPSWSARNDRRTAVSMSPLFSSHLHPKPSSPQPGISPTTFYPSPYILSFKRQVSDGTDGGIVKATCYGFDEAMQRTSGQIRELTSFRERSEVASDFRNKVTSNDVVLNEDVTLPVGAVEDDIAVEGKSWEGQENFRFQNTDNLEKQMSNTVTEKVEVKSNGWRRQESGKGSRSRNMSIGHQDIDLSSMSSSTREEFFDAPEEPLEGNTSDEDSLRGQRTARTKPDCRRDVDVNLNWQLDQEIKRRMAAEDAMAVLQLQCSEMASHLMSVDGGNRGLIDLGGSSWDSSSLAQKLVVARIVAASVARGAARAEVGEEMENVVAEKNREITRLRDKLHYYELVNQEMSQRNQEAFELARNRRHMRRNRNQWLTVCAGSAICLGITALVVGKFVPWASSRFPSGAVLQSHSRTDIHHSLSHDA